VEALIWDDAEYGYVRIERAEGGAQNEHPVTLTPDQIRNFLGTLEVRSGSNDKLRPVFTEEELNDIAGPLSMALAQAQPSQDITFASTGTPGRLGRINVFTPRYVTTGRVFYADGRLNIIFGLIQGEFEGQLRATGVLRPFTPGSRDKRLTADATVQPPVEMQYASAKRGDWIQVAPAALPATAVAATAVAATSTQTGATTGTSQSSRVQPAASVAAPAAAVQPVAGSATESKDSQYQRFEARLTTLRKLRDSNLISEHEYQAKRRAILDEL
jgi:hypothetical protein